MANQILLNQLQNLVITKEDMKSIKHVISTITYNTLSTYRANLYKKSGVPFNPQKSPERPQNLQALRKLYLETFEKSLALNKKVAMKFIKDQREREKRKQDRESLLQHKQETFEIYRSQEEEAKFQQKQLEKQRKLENLRVSSEKRKNLLNYYQNLESPSKPVPLFKQIQENYQIYQQMPELERRKQELESKRALFKPISLQEIREHAERSKRVLESIQEKRQNKSISLSNSEKIKLKQMRTKFTQSVVENDRKMREIEENRRIIAKSLMDKKKEYGKIVSDLYQPSIDKFKEQEMKLIKARLELPVRFKIRDLNGELESNCSRSLSVQPKTWKKNKMIPEEPVKKTGKFVDYLAERRKVRELSLDLERKDGDWSLKAHDFDDKDEKMSFLKKKAKVLDNKARSLEIKLDKKKINVDVAERVNELIINSIRAKLSYLE